MKLTVIIPTWNSMPAFKNTLESIKREIPSQNLEEILVIDKNSSDGTVNLAKEYVKDYNLPIRVIIEEGTLGKARMLGIHEARTDWIAFIDSDIELCDGWFSKLQEHISDDVGWVVGIVLNINPLIRDEQLYRRSLKTGGSVRFITKGERAYTHNALCRRAPLLGVDISNMNAWEDYLLTQAMLDAGYKIKQVPVTSFHLKEDEISEYTEAWGMPGIIKTKGRVYAFFRMFHWIWWGIRTAVHFKKFWYFSHNFKIFSHQFHAFIFPKHFFESKRGEQ